MTPKILFGIIFSEIKKFYSCFTRSTIHRDHCSWFLVPGSYLLERMIYDHHHHVNVLQTKISHKFIHSIKWISHHLVWPLDSCFVSGWITNLLFFYSFSLLNKFYINSHDCHFYGCWLAGQWFIYSLVYRFNHNHHHDDQIIQDRYLLFFLF